MDAVIAAAADSDARLVYVDNLYMYGPVVAPLREDLPAAATTNKGRLRAELAERLLEAHVKGRVRATIGRSSDYYGPGVTSSAAGEELFRTILQGGNAPLVRQPRAAPLPDLHRRRGRRPHHARRGRAQPGRDLAPAGRRTADRPSAHRAGQRDRRHAARPRRFPAWAIRLAGLVNPMAREFAELAYQFEQPFVVDWTKYRQTFGGAPTPPREGLATTLAWYRGQMGATVE